jgi:hypothetical protein
MSNNYNNSNIYCFAIFQIEIMPKIIAFYSPTNNILMNDVKTVFSHRNFNMSTSFSSFEHDGYAWNLIMDNNSIFFLIITKINYSKRLIMLCFEELQIQYNAKQINTNQNIKDLQFNNNLLSILKKLYAKYNDPKSFDSISKVTDKLEQTKDIMHENIDVALENCVKLETIELKSEELQQSAGIFKYNAKHLKNKMWWKNIKMKLIIGSIIVVILLIIILTAVYSSKS